VDLAKAMEGVWDLGAHAEEPSGVGDVERVRRSSRELERPYSVPILWGLGASLPITGDPGKWPAAERESEGVVVVVTVRTTQPGQSEGPLLHRCTT
jgi:hypothetical protein